MPYQTLGPTGSEADYGDRVRTSLMRIAALRRAGPGGRLPPMGAGAGEGRDRMEARYLRRAMQARMERESDAEAAIASEQSRAKLEQMRSQAELGERGAALAERQQGFTERMEPEKLAFLQEQNLQRLAAEEADRGIREREVAYRTGPAHGLAERELDIRERGTENEGIDAKMRVLQALHDQAVEAGDARRAAEIRDTMARMGMGIIGGYLPTGRPSTTIGGETPEQAYSAIKAQQTEQDIGSSVATSQRMTDDARMIASMIDQKNGAGVASYLRGILIADGIEPTAANVKKAFGLILRNEAVKSALSEITVRKRTESRQHEPGELRRLPAHQIGALMPYFLERMEQG